MSATMRALVLESSPFGFAVRDLPCPQPGTGEALIKIEVCLICGSDLHTQSGRRRAPIIMGHEFAGKVVSVGRGEDAQLIGKRVTADSTLYCGECPQCRKGQVNICREKRIFGVHCDAFKLDGAFSQYLVVPIRLLHLLPDNVTFTQGAFVEPLAVALNAVEQAKSVDGSRVAVFGCGNIGALVCLHLARFRPAKLIAIDVDPAKLALAKDFGATTAINPQGMDEQQVIDAIFAETGREGLDYAFEAVGRVETVRPAVLSLAPGGTIVAIGNTTPAINVPWQHMVANNKHMRAATAICGQYPACVALLGSGKLDVLRMLGACWSLEEAADKFADHAAGKLGLFKVAILPNGPCD